MTSMVKYIRVSTKEQNTARQEVDADKYVRIFIDKASGKDAKRPELEKMLEYVREGDTVVVESYSRFARNTKDLLTLIERLNEKGVAFISQKEQIDTSTPQGRFMLTVFSGLAQFEREQLLQRQAEGIAFAKQTGKYKGRQPIKVDDGAFRTVYADWRDGKITAKKSMSLLSLKPNTFYRRVAEYEQRLPIINK